jgi:uncharacterized membrane protein SirB2
MSLLLFKYLHILSVATAFALFFVRGLWVMQSYPDSQERWVRVLPHAVDAVLVLSGIAMLAMLPAGRTGEWLAVKLALVVVYALLALYLFRVAQSFATKASAWLLGLLLILFITTIAVLGNPLGIFSVL